VGTSSCGIGGAANSRRQGHKRRARADHLSNFVAPESIRGANADADDVAVFNLSRFYSSQSLIDKAWVAKAHRFSRRQHIQPARRNDGSAERDFTWVN
jgi:hypothetical protein